MWKRISAFPDYEVNDGGAVKRSMNNRPVHPSANQQGNLYVGLSRDRKQFKRSLALIVAIEFLGEPANYRFDTPIHVDGDKRNCAATNLMWRPRWFALAYHQQFNNNVRGFRVPVIDMATREVFPTSWEAAVKYGLLDKEIRVAAMNRTAVFPTGQIIRPVDDFEE